MDTYLWLKTGHLISLVAWFAGLFYIFRLFVYHVKHKDDEKTTAVLSTMEYKLLYMITHPAMALTIIFGIALLLMNPELLKSPWMHIKLTFVVILIAYQIYSGIIHKKMKNGNYPLSEKACRIINEVPTLCLIVIIIMAVIKPI